MRQAYHFFIMRIVIQERGLAAVILSASRRTDIPNYYPEWFFNRLKEGYAYVRNPMNPRQVSKVPVTPDVVDCIVFWTKNPARMLGRLDELAAYNYYFQFTLTGFGQDVERGVPHKRKKMIPIFKELSRRIGKERVIWRYDPIIITERYSAAYHINAFRQIAEALDGYTQKVVISFVDMYSKIRKNVEKLGMEEISSVEKLELASRLSFIARENHMDIGACAEETDFSEAGIGKNSCIDKQLIEKLCGYPLNVPKDRNQRKACGCVESIDIGTYNTCRNGCAYCYANYSEKSVAAAVKNYDAASPLLCGRVMPEDIIKTRAVKSLKA